MTFLSETDLRQVADAIDLLNDAGYEHGLRVDAIEGKPIKVRHTASGATLDLVWDKVNEGYIVAGLS